MCGVEMSNKNYISGRRREYAIMNKLKADGKIVLRMAGSKGFCDLVSIDPVTRTINFIQVKPKSMSANAKDKIQNRNSWVEGVWDVETCTISSVGEMK